VGQLAGGIAHDFNNVLTAILSFARFVRDDLGPGHPSLPDVEEILSAADRAAALTRQLLAFGRRQAVTPARPVDLGETVRTVERLLRRIIGEGIELRVEVSGEPWVKGDGGQLEQVVVNLALNARDAMPGGGRLRLSVRELAPDEAARAGAGLPAGPLVALAVEDEGVGMDAATCARAFEPFFTTKPPGKGSGLGLSTVYGIVHHARGTVLVRSAPGAGSTFTVFFPRCDERPDHVAAPRAAGAARGREAVLLVEDDEAIRALARRTLGEAGYAVRDAGRPGDALALARGGAFDLLLTDVILPETTGPQLAVALRAEHPALRVLYVSGYTAGHLDGQGALAPGDAFLAKPFTPEALLRAVRAVLDGGAVSRLVPADAPCENRPPPCSTSPR
jgi:CheY-like chemotaxis protein